MVAFQKVESNSTRAKTIRSIDIQTNNSLAKIEKESNEAAKQAKDCNIQKYPIIKPFVGTLAYYIMQIEGTTFTVATLIESFLQAEPSGSGIRLKKLYDDFIKLDEDSQKRLDIFDILCRIHRIPNKSLWAVIQAELYEFHNTETKLILTTKTPKLANRVLELAQKEDRFADRKLATEMTGLVSKGPNVLIDQSIVNNTQNNVNNSFNHILKKVDDVIDTDFDEIEPKQLQP